jgi:hypothetical protein
MPGLVRASVVGLVAFAALAASADAIAPRPSAALPPFAAGDDAANIALRSSGDRVVIRWVARRTGRLQLLSVRVKIAPAGYGGGTTGVLHATTHPVLPDGRPRTGVVLAETTLSPRRRQWGGTVLLPLGFAVRAGQEFATVIRNDAGDPHRDYFSANFLHTDAGLIGATGRNERSSSARDSYYGLDPRELVGFSRDGGESWNLPGGPYGARRGRAFIPTYVQLYADGHADGQFYYWSEPASGRVTMVFPDMPAWRITRLGAFVRGGASTVVLAVDGERRAAARLAGTGFVSRAVTPVSVHEGATVTLTATAGGDGLALSRLHADSVWARLVGLGSRYRWFLEGDPDSAVPLYPLPFPRS